MDQGRANSGSCTFSSSNDHEEPFGLAFGLIKTMFDHRSLVECQRLSLLSDWSLLMGTNKHVLPRFGILGETLSDVMFCDTRVKDN